MSNPIRKNLDTHAGKGYKHLTAAEEDLFAIYLRARNQIERRLSTFLQRKKASFTGPQLVTLFEDLQAIFPEMEEQYRSVYEDSLSYMAKQNYAAFLHDMGLEENVLGSMDKTLFDNMKQDGFTHIAGATRKMQADVISNLRKMSARVMREAALTGMTRAEVSRKLAFENGYGMDSLFQQNGQKGGSFQFIDAAGKQWKTDAYFKMLGRTLLHNNSRECYLSACAKEGSDIVTISISGDPCDICARYENRLLSISGKTKGLTTLQQAMSEGLFHPNCTHRMIAVPEVVAQEYYDKDGKEKTEYRVDWENHLLHQQIRKEQREEARLNREDRKKAEEDRKKAAHEAHLKHRQKQLSQAKKNRTKREAETHEEHLKRRKEQEQRAYENRKSKWIKEMKDAGVDEHVSNTLTDLYTPEMARLGKPPKMKPTPGRGYYLMERHPKGGDKFRGTIKFDPNSDHPIQTIQHEFGHWVDYHTRMKMFITQDFVTWNDVNNASILMKDVALKDLNSLKVKMKKKYPSKLKALNYNTKIAKEEKHNTGDYWLDILDSVIEDHPDLTNSELDYIVICYKDLVGDISDSKYGGGHTKKEYNGSYGHGEAFANAFAALARGDKIIELDFPEITKYIKGITGKE